MHSLSLSAGLLSVLLLLACDESKQGPAAAKDGDSAAARTAAGDGQIVMDSIPIRTPEGGPARYGVKSGEIEYTYAGGVGGVRRVVFDRWGIRERRFDSSAPVGGGGAARHVLLITTEETTSAIDFTQKKGWTTPNIADDRYMTDSTAKGVSLGEMIFRTSGAKRLPDETFNGYSTRVLLMENPSFTSKIWVWRGIVLKEEFKDKNGLTFTVTASKMAFDVQVPESAFVPPSDIPLEKREMMAPEPMPLPEGNRPPGPGPGTGPMPMPAPRGGGPMPMPPGGAMPPGR